MTSFTELARDGRIVNAGTCCTRWKLRAFRISSGDERRSGSGIYRLYETVRWQVRTYVPADDYRVLGTDGFVVPTAVRTCVTTSKLMLLMSGCGAGRTG